MIVDTSSAVVISNYVVLILLIIGLIGTNAGLFICIKCHFDMDRIKPKILRMLVKHGWSAGIIILLLSNYFRLNNMNSRVDYIKNHLQSETGCEANHVKDNTFELYKNGRFQGFAYAKDIGNECYEIIFTNNASQSI